MVSFDVVSLFTNVPIQLALNIAKQRLQSDSELSLGTGLSTADLIKRLEICLNATKFTSRGKHYKQVCGTAMGSPVSSVAANLVMENIETRALETFADPPGLWKRYVDDTFVIMKRSKLSEFVTHLNTLESFIQFTVEKEKGCLPFLDLLIKRSPSSHLLSAVYRKPTHFDRYFNFRSHSIVRDKLRSCLQSILYIWNRRECTSVQTFNPENHANLYTELLFGVDVDSPLLFEKKVVVDKTPKFNKYRAMVERLQQQIHDL